MRSGVFFFFIFQAWIERKNIFYAFGCTWEGPLIQKRPPPPPTPYSFRRGPDNVLMINWVYAELLNCISGGKSLRLSFQLLSSDGVQVGGGFVALLTFETNQHWQVTIPLESLPPPRGQSADEWFICGRLKCSFSSWNKMQKGKSAARFAWKFRKRSLKPQSPVNDQDGRIVGRCWRSPFFPTSLKINLLQ